MKLETILRDVIHIYEAAEAGTPARAAAWELRQQLESAVRAQAVRQASGARVAAVWKRMHKIADKNTTADRAAVLKKCWPSKTKHGELTGVTVVPGMFYAFRLAQDPGLERAEPNEILNMDGIIDRAQHDATERVELPTLADVKAWREIKRAEGQNNALYPIGSGLFNPDYLLDVLTVMGPCEAWQRPTSAATAPMYFTGSAGDAILMPVCRKS